MMIHRTARSSHAPWRTRFRALVCVGFALCLGRAGVGHTGEEGPGSAFWYGEASERAQATSAPATDKAHPSGRPASARAPSASASAPATAEASGHAIRPTPGAAEAGPIGRSSTLTKAEIAKEKRRVLALCRQAVDRLDAKAEATRAEARGLLTQNDMLAAHYLLKRLARHGAAERRAAVPVLSTLKSPEAQLALARLALHDEERAIRAEASQALASVGGDLARAYIVHDAARAVAHKAVHAAQAIATIGDKRYLDELIPVTAATGPVRVRWNLETVHDVETTPVRVATHPGDGVGAVLWDLNIQRPTTENWEGETTAVSLSLLMGHKFGGDMGAWAAAWEAEREEYEFPDPATIRPPVQ